MARRKARQRITTTRVEVGGATGGATAFEYGEGGTHVFYQHEDESGRIWLVQRRAEECTWYASVTEPGAGGRTTSLNSHGVGGEQDDPLAHLGVYDTFALLNGLVPLIESDKWPTE